MTEKEKSPDICSHCGAVLKTEKEVITEVCSNCATTLFYEEEPQTEEEWFEENAGIGEEL